MAVCKKCGKETDYPVVFHPACWETAFEQALKTFCDEYCRWPRECASEEELEEKHCFDCGLVHMMNLGLTGGQEGMMKEKLKMKLTEQDVLCLTNNEKRKAVLAAWREWPVWADVPEIGLTVYRLDLPGGGAFTASWYAGDDFFPGGGTRNANRPRFHLIGHDGKLASGSQKESVLLEQLRSYRVETDLASWHPEICDRAADCITDLMARCDRLEEARENANEACAKWETLCHMAEQERDQYKAALQNWHEEG